MSSEIITVTLDGVPVGAAVDTLLAVEKFADQMYRDRAENEHSQARYNDLAAVVLPLREAVDALNAGTR